MKREIVSLQFHNLVRTEKGNGRGENARERKKVKGSDLTMRMVRRVSRSLCHSVTHEDPNTNVTRSRRRTFSSSLFHPSHLHPSLLHPSFSSSREELKILVGMSCILTHSLFSLFFSLTQTVYHHCSGTRKKEQRKLMVKMIIDSSKREKRKLEKTRDEMER